MLLFKIIMEITDTVYTQACISLNTAYRMAYLMNNISHEPFSNFSIPPSTHIITTGTGFITMQGRRNVSNIRGAESHELCSFQSICKEKIFNQRKNI